MIIKLNNTGAAEYVSPTNVGIGNVIGIFY
jgi:hypothetical protein